MVIVNQNLGVGKGLKSGRNPRFSAMELPLLARRVNNRRLCFFSIAAKARQRLARVGGIRVRIESCRRRADFAASVENSRIFAPTGARFAAEAPSDSRRTGKPGLSVGRGVMRWRAAVLVIRWAGSETALPSAQAQGGARARDPGRRLRHGRGAGGAAPHSALLLQNREVRGAVADGTKNDKSRPARRPLSCCNLYEILAPAVGIEPTTN